ncbi:MAG TPA: hypothetical protein VGX92_17485 [Pyrinomonadaceae bacterium]|jgi:predicted membrane GTPase involved in stress response|nr:hypothetical protein [Pyrinomonadaceae bacterium]
MKRAFVSLVLLAIVLALSSCQSIDNFVVTNRSDAPIEVVYTFMRTSSSEIHVEKPQMMDAANLKDTDRTWEAVPNDQYMIDSQAGKVRVRLAPGKALLLTSANNYQKESAEADVDFGISSLSIMGAKGSIKLEGRQARMLFRYEEECHVITYE